MTENLGHMPIDKIKATLGVELDAGSVRLPQRIAEKICEKHPEALDIFQRNATLVLTDPTYIGEHPKHPGKVELIRRFSSEAANLLIAVALEPTPQGNYNIASAYLVSDNDIQKWRNSQRLKPTVR
jgi:hypothetical protein